MHAHRQRDIGVAEGIVITHDVDSQAADGWQKQFDILTRDQLRVHAVGLFKQVMTNRRLAHSHALRDSRKVPHWFHSSLGHVQLSTLQQNLAVCFQATSAHQLLDFSQVAVRLCDGDGWTDVPAFLNLGREYLSRNVSPWIDCDDLQIVRTISNLSWTTYLLWVTPGWERPNRYSRISIREIWAICWI